MGFDTAARLHSLYLPQGGVGEVFSAKVAEYAASRPDYPTALVDMLQAEGDLRPQSVIADLGSGTGLLAHVLLMRGYTVVGVEPNDGMRVAADHLLGSFEHYRGVAGSAESIPLPNCSVDLVTAAQSFHWFDAEKTKSECLRVLRGAGKVALIWNDRVLMDPLHAALDHVFATYGGAKRDALIEHEQRRDLAPFFGSTIPVRYSWPHEHALNEAGLLSLVFSRSYMPDRDSIPGAEAARELRGIFARFVRDGSVAIRYTTVAFVGRPQ